MVTAISQQLKMYGYRSPSIMRLRVRKTGFTVVELLVVIVVIAILAVITIVAYNGVTERAENTKTITAVKAYEKALLQYAVDNGSYPTLGGMCLGDSYPILDGTTGGCRYSTAILTNSSATTMVNALKPYMGGSFPMPSTKLLHDSSTGRDYVGSYFYGTNYSITLDGVAKVGLFYTIEGNDCPIGPAYTSNNWPDLLSSNQGRYGSTGASGSRCLILLPDAFQL
jgi:prepilin-type N-terminal cleavage/methylation domain-containing protein